MRSQDEAPTPARRKRALALAVAAALAITLAVWWVTPGPPAPLPCAASAAGPPAPGARYSLFALGDTGEQHALPTLFEGQLAVARALTHHDLAAPVDALLLLGDNFYPDGLAQDTLVPRIAANLVWPYCRFVALDGARSAQVAHACALPDSLRRKPAPRLLAVLGSHDYGLPESAELQRRAIPRFVTNWSVPEGPAGVVELAPGLSLVLVDTRRVRQSERAAAALIRALRASRGPWRILAGHDPLAPRTDEPYGRALRQAVQQAGVPIQLYLSGHEHDLRVIEGESPQPALQVISGGGATHRPIEQRYVGERFAVESTGFARIDQVESGGEQALVVTLYTTPRYPWMFWRESEQVARFSVARDGALRDASAAPAQPLD